MPSQNLNSYYFPKYSIKLEYGQYFDFTLAADERDYDEEVVFSPNIIAKDDGNRLPINIDLDNSGNTLQSVITFGNYIFNNTLISSNYYNPNNLDFSCYTAYTGICDVGLVATDNGLFTGLTGQTLYYIKGIDDTYKLRQNIEDLLQLDNPINRTRQMISSLKAILASNKNPHSFDVIKKFVKNGILSFDQELFIGI